MTMRGDLTVSATLASNPNPNPNVPPSFPFPPPKVKFSGSSSGGAGSRDVKPRWPGIALESSIWTYRRLSTVSEFYRLGHGELPPKCHKHELLCAFELGVEDPSQMTRKSSNARIAKHRLKMILFSDRCAVSNEAKQKIVTNIVHALSDLVEIESQDKVQLTVATDEDLGTIYSVTVPVRRVKPAYQDSDEVGAIANVEYNDTG